MIGELAAGVIATLAAAASIACGIAGLEDASVWGGLAALTFWHLQNSLRLDRLESRK